MRAETLDLAPAVREPGPTGGSGATWMQLTASFVARMTDGVVPLTTPHDEDSPDDYRRVVIVIALVAVGFFAPALAIAAVPFHLWLPFAGLAMIAAIILAGSFIRLPRHSRWIPVSVSINAITVATLGFVLRPYFHEVVLLYALVTAAHVVLHGIRPAFLMAVLGGFLVPTVIQGDAGTNVNLTDSVYVVIYLGGVSVIPWVAGRLAQGRLVEVRRHLRAVTATEREAVHMLARAAEAKDDVTGNHVLRVADLAGRLAVAASVTRPEEIAFAAMLHDVGKLHVPDRILMKRAPLDADEWEIIKDHTIWGERILGGSAGFELARRVARSHHENWDGSGYPDGHRGEATPLAARIVHIADVFDALLAARPYKPAWPLDRCIDEIRRGSGRLFDPDLVEEFLRLADAGALAHLGQGADVEGVFEDAVRAPIVTGSAAGRVARPRSGVPAGR